jgi:hypothetical protein
VRPATTSDRLNLAGFIARAGPGAATVLLDEIAKTSAPSDVLRLLEVLPHSMPIDMAEMAMAGLLRHPAVAVRKRTALMVAEQGYPRAGAALMDAFATEADLPTKIVFIECLGRLRHKAAIDMLAEVIDSRQQVEELRSAACMALGRIGDLRAVAPLARLVARGDKGLTKIFVKIPPSIRATAVRALALFPSNPDARSAIRKAQEDGETIVRSAASQARYAPLYEAFGDLAQGVIMISNAADLGGEAVKAGGALSEIPFESLCRKIAAAENMGLLNVNFGGPVGRIYFDAGLVIAAEFEGRRDHEAFAAMIPRRGPLHLPSGEALQTAGSSAHRSPSLERRATGRRAARRRRVGHGQTAALASTGTAARPSASEPSAPERFRPALHGPFPTGRVRGESIILPSEKRMFLTGRRHAD